MVKMIYLIPLISAIIGWLTNWLAVKMIFRPYNRSWFFNIQGMIPKRRNDLARKVSEVVGDTLVVREDIEKIIEQADISPLIEEKVIFIFENKILTRLTGLIPVMKIIPAEVIDKFRAEMTAYIETEILTELTHKIALRIKEKDIVRDIIYEKIKAFSVEKLEEIVLKIAHRELKAIEYLGAVIGFVIGVFQLLMILYT